MQAIRALQCTMGRASRLRPHLGGRRHLRGAPPARNTGTHTEQAEHVQRLARLRRGGFFFPLRGGFSRCPRELHAPDQAALRRARREAALVHCAVRVCGSTRHRVRPALQALEDDGAGRAQIRRLPGALERRTDCCILACGGDADTGGAVCTTRALAHAKPLRRRTSAVDSASGQRLVQQCRHDRQPWQEASVPAPGDEPRRGAPHSRRLRLAAQARGVGGAHGAQRIKVKHRAHRRSAWDSRGAAEAPPYMCGGRLRRGPRAEGGAQDQDHRADAAGAETQRQQGGTQGRVHGRPLHAPLPPQPQDPGAHGLQGKRLAGCCTQGASAGAATSFPAACITLHLTLERLPCRRRTCTSLWSGRRTCMTPRCTRCCRRGEARTPPARCTPSSPRRGSRASATGEPHQCSTSGSAGA